MTANPLSLIEPHFESPLLNMRAAVLLSVAINAWTVSDIASDVRRDPRNVRIVLAHLETEGYVCVSRRVWNVSTSGVAEIRRINERTAAALLSTNLTLQMNQIGKKRSVSTLRPRVANS